jgi:hypothetical protein
MHQLKLWLLGSERAEGKGGPDTAAGVKLVNTDKLAAEEVLEERVSTSTFGSEQ